MALAALLGSASGAGAAGPPTGRLPRDVVPLHYALHLTIDPAAVGFRGEVRIRVRLAEPTPTIWLHARDLEIEAAVLSRVGRADEALAPAIVHESGVLRLDAQVPLAAGEATLRLGFAGAFGSGLDGTYRVRVGGDAYVMTQMEPLAARKSFPCFDEPAFKTPWDVTLVAPAGHVAVANARALGSRELDDGRVEHRFATTAPLPSYLIAYAVGPWDRVTAAPVPPTPQRSRPLPLSGLAARGRGPALALARAETARLLTALEAWFGLPYPFDKLDLLAAPDFAFGAMENAGLISYRESLLLLDEDAPTAVRQAFLVVHLHELAHQWFGNSVTMPWWDDLWLNEAFATWLSGKLGARLEPGHGLPLREREALQRVMREDGLESARRIAEPIRDYRDVASAFDGITYRKGAAVLGMFEAFLGAERFRAGVQRYLRTHAGGNATTDDLLAALAADSADPAGLTAAFRSFLDQPGVPLVSLGLECRAGAAWLVGEQRRFLPLGSRAAAGRVWGLPLCVRGAGQTSQCAMVRAPQFAFPLQGAACDDWLMPNAGADGYYRFRLAPEARARLDRAFDELSAPEQLAVADGLAAEFDAGSLSLPEALAAAERLAASSHWPVAAAPLPILRFLREQLAGPSGRAALEARIRRLYRPRLAALGLDESADEPDEKRLERQELVEVLARAKDRRLRGELIARARAVVEEGSLEARRLAANQRAGVLWVLAQDGSDAEFEAIVRALGHERDAQLRRELLRALGAATAPARASRARALALDPAVRAGEVLALLGSHFDRERNRAEGRAWLLAHQDALFERLPALHAASLPAHFAEGACSEAEARAVDAHFRERVAKLEGGPRALAKLGERIRLCAALRAHHRSRGLDGAFADPHAAVPR